MPKLNQFKIRIETGGQGTEGPIRFSINSHQLPLESVSGGTGAEEVFEGGYSVNSFAHSLSLVGPEKGEWSLRKVKVDYDCENTAPYSVEFGEVTLDESTELDIWKDPPLPTFDC
ncbi:MAG: helicase [Nitrospinae bacterium]|nr:helicase [Nitrospinota bacterium]